MCDCEHLFLMFNILTSKLLLPQREGPSVEVPSRLTSTVAASQRYALSSSPPETAQILLPFSTESQQNTDSEDLSSLISSRC